MILVIGAGPAGLATAYYLQQHGLDYCVLEKHSVGYSWQNHYDRLHLHTLKAVSGLPGLPMPANYPDFPSARQVQAYLQDYARHFRLNIEEGVEVCHASYQHNGWHLQTSKGERRGQVLVLATGIWSTPIIPAVPGIEQFDGQITHASTYRNPQPFVGQRVLVVGAGNSGAEIAVDLSEHGVDTAIAIRSGSSFVAYPRSALAMRLMAWFFRHAPRIIARPLLARARRTFDHIGIRTHPDAPLDTYPVVGYELPEAVAAGQVRAYAGLCEFIPGGARFEDGQEASFDSVIMATGYRPTVQMVRHAFEFDQDGFPRLSPRGRSTRNPHLYAVGFRYPTTAGFLQSLGREAQQVVRDLVHYRQRAA
jgi:cation diffusion facilitator CzcD-associated flavoprotein CzcO